MIVPVSSEKYKNLFAEAAAFLNLFKEEGEDDIVINSINEYYSHMNSFYRHASRGPEYSKGYKYIMMPLDDVGENAFDINLNTRAITVPVDFAKVGGVQSDQMAELVIFSVDRYFDYMDLANARIYVQWQLPDKDHTTGATEIQIKDLESKPGKMRFAWPLYDTITENSGVVKFSVRFFIANDQNELAYSLNTLESTLVIKPALDPTATPTVEHVNDLFSSAIINSQYTNDGRIPPQDPTFGYPGLEMTIMSEGSYVRNFSEADGKSEPKTTKVAKLNSQDQLVMQAQAVTGDAGALHYTWKRRKDEPNAAWEIIASTRTDLDEVPATNVNMEVVRQQILSLPSNAQGEPYLDFREKYVLEDGQPYSGWTIPVDAENKYDKSLYEEFIQYSIPQNDNDVVGTYAVIAENMIGNMVAGPIWSTHCYLPGPADITFDDKTGSVYTLVREDNAIKEIKINRVTDINNPTIGEQWVRSFNSEEDAVFKAKQENITEAISPTENLMPGWYCVKVTANLNRKDKVASPEVAQVIYAEPKIDRVYAVNAADQETNETFVDLPQGGTTTLRVKADVPVPEGFVEGGLSNDLYKNLTYKWEYKKSDATQYRPITKSLVGETAGHLIAEWDETERTPAITVRNIATDNSGTTFYNFKCKVINALGDKNVSQEQETYFLIG